jgi:hypothetical protein
MPACLLAGSPQPLNDRSHGIYSALALWSLFFRSGRTDSHRPPSISQSFQSLGFVGPVHLSSELVRPFPPSEASTSSRQRAVTRGLNHPSHFMYFVSKHLMNRAMGEGRGGGESDRGGSLASICGELYLRKCPRDLFETPPLQSTAVRVLVCAAF